MNRLDQPSTASPSPPPPRFLTDASKILNWFSTDAPETVALCQPVCLVCLFYFHSWNRWKRQPQRVVTFLLPWGLAIVWAAAAGPAAAPPAAPPAGSRSFPRLFRGLAPVPAASPCGFPAGCSHPLPLSLLHFCNTQSHVYSPFNHRDFWIFCSLFFSSSFLFFFFQYY